MTKSGTSLLWSNYCHNSALERYRFPLGAVPCGTDVRLSLEVFREPVFAVYLCVSGMGEFLCTYDDNGLYSAIFTVPEHICVLRYHFLVRILPSQSELHGDDPGFQITVFEPGFKTPCWAKSAVMYQIFPDRFFPGNMPEALHGLEHHQKLGRTNMHMHDSWDELPEYLPAEGEKDYNPNDIFGGDLEGIRLRLEYLKNLGVSLIYLNPIFEASSNHRYNTGDYLNVDPILGTNESFARLAEEAGEVGIKIILDGVFSHTGDDSVYFNKYGRYKSIGAFQSTNSPYISWYSFSFYPDRYKAWWNFMSLPEVDESNLNWRDFVISGENSVIKTWLRRGASGFRLDVADELPDETIAEMRSIIKAENPEAFLLGEVWEDATTKLSYGKERQYALGAGLDSVMNYPLAEAVISFLRGDSNAYDMAAFLVSQQQNYPREMYYSLMNLLSSHDIPRIRTALAIDRDPDSMTRSEQAEYMLSASEGGDAAALQRLAAMIQFAIPGIPAVYYGDEAGMPGLNDPFNRLTYRVCDEEMPRYYRSLAEMRNGNQVFSLGEAAFFAVHERVLCILRYRTEPAFEAVLCVVNAGAESGHFVVDLFDEREGMTMEAVNTFKKTNIENGLVDVHIEPYSAEVLYL